MKALSLTLMISACMAIANVASAQVAAPAAPVAVYDEHADARAELNQALAAARTQHKNVLVVFGANWCPDCRALDHKMKGGPLATLVDKRYVLLKVDVGRFNRNTDLAEQMGVPLKKGIPAAAVLKSDGDVLKATSGGELADARSMGDEAVISVLQKLHDKG